MPPPPPAQISVAVQYIVTYVLCSRVTQLCMYMQYINTGVLTEYISGSMFLWLVVVVHTCRGTTKQFYCTHY